MSICELEKCLCVTCQNFDDCPTNDCWDCDEGCESIRKCNDYKKIVDKTEEK